jgi:hypothetical protein
MILTLTLVSTAMVSCSDSSHQTKTEKKPEINITTVVSPADGLDLKLVGALLQEGKVKNAEELEKELNKEGGINNLDLNSDGNVDFINVAENKSDNPNIKSLDLTTGDTTNLTHIATVEVEKKGEEYHINMAGNHSVYGEHCHYHSSFHHTGELLFYAWLFSPRPYYYHPPFYAGFYPAYYGGPRTVVSQTTYVNRTSTQRTTANRNFRSTNASNTKVKSTNNGKTATTSRSSINAHNKQVKQMSTRSASKPVSKQGFTSRSSSSTTRTSTPSRSSSSSWGSSSSRSSSRSSSSSWGSSSRSSSRSFGGSRSSGGSRRSDATYKTDVVSFNNGLSTIMQLNGVYYYWKPIANYDEVVGGSYDSTRQVGFIAQDVQQVIPEIVEEDKYGKVVNYDLLVPVLVNAIQQQQAQIDSLKLVLSNSNK